MVRVVLDTNVFVSALLIPDSPPARILEMILTGTVELVMSPGIIQEVAMVFTYDKVKKSLQKHGVTEEDVAEAFFNLLKIATITPGSKITPGASADPADDMVLACALEGQAEVIISGDKDLLQLASYEGVNIVSPATFLQKFTEKV